MPRGLFGRSLVIIVTPVVLLQVFVSFAFFERHYDIVTARMARGVAADVSFLVSIHETEGLNQAKLLNTAAKNLGYGIKFIPSLRLQKPYHHAQPYLNGALNETFTSQLGEKRAFTSYIIREDVDLRVQTKDGVLQLLIPRKRMTASNADVFVLWMVISSLVLLAVAILFLRNQVRPIERLAKAAESFGKGRSVPDFKPSGATEVRRAAQAFITMRERIERYVQQRTDMLAGVSHDLKTPLTRIKLELAMMPKGSETQAIQNDLGEMDHMLNEYLDFARGEGGEEPTAVDIGELVHEAAATLRRINSEQSLNIDADGSVILAVRRGALKRCISNLIENALKYGRRVSVSVPSLGRAAEIHVDDDGPGIPKNLREEAFRPFHRLDQGRNLQTGGSGLGLAIARDIARAHGGDVILNDSKLGGLRATIRLPI